MRLSLFKMTVQGKVAVFNLVLFAILVLVGEFILDRFHCEGTTLSSVFNAAFVVITCPLGWFASAMSCRETDTLMYLIFLQPINAYMWGYAASGVAEWIQHMSRPDSGVPVEENLPENKK